jgi:hypothetical protein
LASCAFVFFLKSSYFLIEVFILEPIKFHALFKIIFLRYR